MSRSRVCSSVGQSAPLIRVRPEVRIFPDPPFWGSDLGAIAQLGEHLPCTQGVVGSIPTGSTRSRFTVRVIPRLHRVEGLDARVVSCIAALLRTLFKNLNLGMTPRNELISTCDSKACRIRKRYQLIDIIWSMTPERLGLYGQANKRTWWMPWR
jgi:hypothetical protein